MPHLQSYAWIPEAMSAYKGSLTDDSFWNEFFSSSLHCLQRIYNQVANFILYSSETALQNDSKSIGVYRDLLVKAKYNLAYTHVGIYP